METPATPDRVADNVYEVACADESRWQPRINSWEVEEIDGRVLILTRQNDPIFIHVKMPLGETKELRDALTAAIEAAES